MKMISLISDKNQNSLKGAKQIPLNIETQTYKINEQYVKPLNSKKSIELYDIWNSFKLNHDVISKDGSCMKYVQSSKNLSTK